MTREVCAPPLSRDGGTRHLLFLRVMKHKLKIIGYYIKPNRKKPNKGVVYDRTTIAPCMCDYSGGGNLVPTVLLAYERVHSDRDGLQQRQQEVL